MTQHQPQPKDERDEQVEASQDDTPLEDLEPDDDEATDVQGGGFRVRGGRGRA